MALPQILYPSQPWPPPLPVVSQVAGGSFAARTYYVKSSWQTLLGESIPGPEIIVSVPAGALLKISPPAQPSYLVSPTLPIQWFPYVGTTAGGETRQVQAPLNLTLGATLGQSWTEPTTPPAGPAIAGTGLIVGPGPRTAWGSLLAFQREPRLRPATIREALRGDAISASGQRQTVALHVGQFFEFDMEWVGLGPDDDAWTDFLLNAGTPGVNFDYYADAAVQSFTTFFLTDTAARIAYKAPAQFSIATLKSRLIRVGSAAAPAGQAPPAFATIFDIGPTALPGNFSFPHGFGVAPDAVDVMMTSPGKIHLQSGLFDATNILLSASEIGLTAKLLAWRSGLPMVPPAQAPPNWAVSLDLVTLNGGALPTGTMAIPHGLGRVPLWAAINMTSAGALWFQDRYLYSNPPFDATNIYLVASDAGQTGSMVLW